MARAATTRRRRLTALVSTALAVGLVSSACTGVLGEDTASPAAESEAAFEHDLDWGDCSEDEVVPPAPEGAEAPPEADIHEDLRCAEAEVPVDHDEPDGRTTTLQVAKLPHTGDGETMGTVLHVAGGPGAPGVPALQEHRDTLAELRENFDIVAWNPRGTMGETAELLPHEVCGHALGPEFAGAQTQEEFDDVVAKHAAVMDQCRDHDPELFDSMDTLQHVGDMEAIREGLGEEQLNLHAHSHGGVRATAYAELHPERLSSVFLDSIVNHVSDYETLTTARLDRLESQFEAFGQWCAESEECALQGENVEERWQTLLARANGEPLPAGEESFDRAQLAHFGGSLTNSEDTWEPFAEAISVALEEGDGTPFLEINGGRLPHTPNLNAADLCGDWAPYDGFDGYQEFNESAVEHSANFGHGQVLRYLKCAAWPDEGANPPGPIEAQGLPPFLLGASELEHEYSAPVADEVPGSGTVTVEGTGHGLYFGESNSCLVEHANRYFADGTLPEEDAFCESD